MGRDKALLPWGESDLLGARARSAARGVTEVRILAGGAPRHLDRGVPVDLDPIAGAGPLGGLLAALEAAQGRAALLLAVDLPLVPAGLLARLVALAAGSDARRPRLSPRAGAAVRALRCGVSACGSAAAAGG